MSSDQNHIEFCSKTGSIFSAKNRFQTSFIKSLISCFDEARDNISLAMKILELDKKDFLEQYLIHPSTYIWSQELP